VPRPPFPKSLREFQEQLVSDRAYADYLAECRWPEGFACPRCSHASAYTLGGGRRWQRAACRYQVSVTAGTVLHNSKTPFATWFWAAQLMTRDKRGLSALLLQRQLGIRCYETVWMILHMLRRAMVNVTREPLRDKVELDETWIGGAQSGIRGSRQLRGRKAALVLVSVERRGRASGRVRMDHPHQTRQPTGCREAYAQVKRPEGPQPPPLPAELRPGTEISFWRSTQPHVGQTSPSVV
jgi:hypothetical protein